MKMNEKIILALIIILFVLSVFMFYYQNVYKVRISEENKIEVLIAEEDILKNTKLTEENTGWVKIDKELFKDEYIQKKDKLLGEKTSEVIFKGEFINKRKVKTMEEDKEYSFNTYVIDINPDFITDLHNGDLIKVYVQTIEKVDKETERVNNLLVFDKKEVLEVIEDEEQKDKAKTLRILVTDKEALSYYNAKKTGTVIALKYEADINKPDYEIPVINIE